MIYSHVQTERWAGRALDLGDLVKPEAQRAFNKQVYF
jgi:hypothetical protein